MLGITLLFTGSLTFLEVFNTRAKHVSQHVRFKIDDLFRILFTGVGSGERHNRSEYYHGKRIAVAGELPDLREANQFFLQ